MVTTRNSPLPFAWLAVLGSLAISVLLFGVIDLLKGLLMHRASLELLDHSLKTSSAENIQEALTRLDSARQDQHLFAIPSRTESEGSSAKQLLTTALSLRAALLAERRADIRIAITELNHHFLEDSKLLGGDKSSFVNLQRLIGNDLRQHEQLQREINTAIASQKEIGNELQSLSSRYDLVAADLYDFFSLNSGLHARIAPFSFYSSGVLSQLPVLDKLDDSIEDFVALRDALAKIGGQVKVSGEDLHQAFIGRLEQIRSMATDVEQRHRGLQQDERALREKLILAKQERGKRRDNLVSSLNHLIVLLSAN